jgi:DNA primase
MARIPEEVIEQLKSSVDLVALVEAAGVVLERTGADAARSTTDHTPSLVVSPEKGLWHCLGACQAGGSAIDRVMRRDGVSFRHAVELLRDGVVPRGGAGASRTTVRRLHSPVVPDATDAEAFARSSTTTTPRSRLPPRPSPTCKAAATHPRRSRASASATPTAPSGCACR